MAKKTCPQCFKVFARKNNRDRHVEIVHNKTPDVIFSSETVNEKLDCKDCGKLFKFKSNLDRHMKIHLGEKSFDCDVCGKSFGRQDNLYKHNEVVHSHYNINFGMLRKTKQFLCEMFDMEFDNQNDLENHIAMKVCQSKDKDKFEVKSGSSMYSCNL